MLSLELSAIVIDFLLGIVLLLKTLKIEGTQRQKYYIGVIGFFLVHGSCRLIFFVRRFFPGNVLMFDVGTILGLSSVVLLVVAIESLVYTKSKHFFSFLGIGAFFVQVIDIFAQQTYFGYRLLLWVHYFVTSTLAVFIIFVYLTAVLKSTGAIRTNAILMLTAIVLFALSELANARLANELIPGVNYIGAILMVASLILLYIAVMNLSVWKRSEETGKMKTIEKSKP
nr:hypothetical protein [Candidatus Sigynarchaeota archaeon]